MWTFFETQCINGTCHFSISTHDYTQAIDIKDHSEMATKYIANNAIKVGALVLVQVVHHQLFFYTYFDYFQALMLYLLIFRSFNTKFTLNLRI